MVSDLFDTYFVTEMFSKAAFLEKFAVESFRRFVLTAETVLLDIELIGVKADDTEDDTEDDDDNADVRLEDKLFVVTSGGSEELLFLLSGKFNCNTVAAGEVESPVVLPEET